MSIAPALTAVCLVLAWVGSAVAAPAVRVDDRGTYAEGLTMRWRADEPGQRGSRSVIGKTRVHVQLQLGAWLGQRARLFMVLPPGDLLSLQVQWRTRGTLLPGQLSSGQRVLVYEGAVSAPLLQDTLDLVVQADGEELDVMRQLEFAFEIEVP